jgi:voltage-gated potassium channel Kch
VRTLWKWLGAGVVVLASLVLGWWGFAAYFAAQGESRTALDVAYLTFQLFVLESGALPGAIPWQLELARILAPTVAAYATLNALALLFSEQLDRLRMRLLRDHVVICGLGRKALVLVRSLREAGERVVVIERDADNDHIAPCSAEGAFVLVGDGRTRRALQSAGVAHARHLVAISEDDASNAAVAAEAQALAHERRGRPLVCTIQIMEPELCSLIRLQQLRSSDDGPFRLELFNVFESGVRMLLGEHPPWPAAGNGETATPHLLVVGLGRFGQALVAETARRARKRPGAGPCVTVLDRRADAKVAALRLRRPWVERTCKLRSLQMDLESPEFHLGTFLRGSEGCADVTCVYVCIDDPTLAWSAALVLHQHLHARGVPIVVRLEQEAGLAALLSAEGLARDPLHTLRPFPLLDRTCGRELLLGGTTESLARAIHEQYVRQRLAAGDTSETNPSMVPWEQLPESLKASNRAQAVHIPVKLHAIGCDLAPLDDPDASAFQFRDTEVEKLAEMEHERWVEERKRAKWERSSQKRIERKESPSLVPWGNLPESVKDIDRHFVRGMPRLVAEAGFRIERVAGSPRTESVDALEAEEVDAAG